MLKEYLTEYKELVESKGASVYFVSIPLAKSSIACDYDEFYKLKNLEEQEIGIEYLSDPTDYFYGDNCFFDAKFHCNEKGQKIKTQQLIDDLIEASVILRT